MTAPDNNPAPEWAVKAATLWWLRAPPQDQVGALARLLASVRDAALREAAEQMQGLTLNEAMHPYDAAQIVASTFKKRILALVGTAPKEAM